MSDFCHSEEQALRDEPGSPATVVLRLLGLGVAGGAVWVDCWARNFADVWTHAEVFVELYNSVILRPFFWAEWTSRKSVGSDRPFAALQP